MGRAILHCFLNKFEVHLTGKRKDHEQPFAVTQRGWRYHHLGIPTTVPHAREQYLEHLKIFVHGFDTSPFGVEWIRFESECHVHDLVRKVPHIAFEVNSFEQAVKGCTMLGEISSPSPGVRVAMIVDDGAPIELIEFSKGKRRFRTKRTLKRKHIRR